MPCTYDGPYTSGDCGHRPELDKLSRMLCEAMAKLEADKHQTISYDSCSTELKNWWNKHKEFDRKRLAAEEAQRKKEQLKQQAIAKLTNAERKALGL